MTQTTQTPSARAGNTPVGRGHSRASTRGRGRRLDQYELLDELGVGGMATVFRAHDTRLGRDVALKILHEHIAGREDNRVRFEQEARAVARLEHPNIIGIYGVSPPDAETQYIAAELVDGPTLRQLIDERGVRVPELGAMVCLLVARALAHAHAEGVIHRDVKPENVMITARGVPKLMDFGLARVLDAERLTQTGAILGSPAHMSPELIEGRPIDARADVFAFGTILFYATTGRLPFEGTNPAVILNAILGGHYADPERSNPRLSPALARTIRACLRRDVDARPASMAEVAEQLEEALADAGLDDPERALAEVMEDPIGWERRQAEATVARLLRRAEDALAAGKPATVVRLCNRLEAWSPGDGRVGALLERAQSARRRRRGVFAGGVGALLVAAVLVVLRLTGPSPTTLQGLDAPTLVDARGARESGAIRPVDTTGPTTPPPDELGTPEAQATSALARVAALAVARAEAQLEIERARRARLEALDPALDRAARQVRRATGRREGAAIVSARRRQRRAEAEARQAELDAEAAAQVLASESERTPPPALPVDVTIRIFPTTARVRIDGVDYGQAADLPSPLRLPPGTYQLAASIEGLPQARIDRSFTVREGPHQTFRYQVPWPPARVRVASRQPGTVFVDGRAVGPTNRYIEFPITGYERTVEVTLVAVPTGRDAEPWRRSVEISAANETSYEANF